MSGFREKFIHSTSVFAKLLSTRLLQKVSGQNLIFPFYHTVSDENLLHINQLYPIKRIKAFEEDLDNLLRHYSPISYPDLQNCIKNGNMPKKPSFLLSFDDGLREFCDVVAPILLKKGVPAICFLNSGFVDNKDLMYRYKVSLLINTLQKNPKLINQLSDSFASLNIKQTFLNINYQNKYLADEIASAIGYRFSDYLREHQPYMNSSQIRELIKKGFHFGGHSIDHPEYQSIPIANRINQTKVSVDAVATVFKLDYRAFSFPFTDQGISKSLFYEFQTSAGVEISFGCAGQRLESVKNHFQRIAFELGNLTGQQILKSELLYYSLKRPFGKNLINRE